MHWWIALFVAGAAASPPRGPTQDALFDEVVTGTSHACGRTSRGGVACWGRNDRGQLGDGTYKDSPEPRPVLGVSDAVALFAGSIHTCALLKDRSVTCWGDNQSGQLGAGTLEAQPRPVQVKDLGAVLSMALGDTHTCAVGTDRRVSCWGNNLYGQLGMSGLRSVPRPIPVPGLPEVLDVAAGYGHTCAMVLDGPPLCWGDPTRGQLGRLVTGSDPQPPSPVEGELPSLRAIEARGNETCALHAQGVTCWGAAPGVTTPAPVPATRVDRPGLISLSMGWGHGCALDVQHAVTCWGLDDRGQLGRLGAQGVSHGAYGLQDAVSVAAGDGESCAARGSSGRTVCWGDYTAEEKAAAAQERPDLHATKPPLRRQIPPGVEVTLSMQEMLLFDGNNVRIFLHSVATQPCANTRIDTEVEERGKRFVVKVGDPYLPGGNCINSPGPAVGWVDLPKGTEGRRDLVLERKRVDDLYQIYIKLNRLEVIPLQETWSIWEGEPALSRVPPGSMAITCTDRLEQPLCERRARDGLPLCALLLRDPKVAEAPRLDRKDYANPWFMTDPDATRISPDEGHAAYKTWFEDTWRDGSRCVDLTVRTWNGQTWTNEHPLFR